MANSPATVLNQITGQPQPAFDDFVASMLSFKADQTAIVNDIMASNPTAFLLPGEDTTYNIPQQPKYGFKWNGDTRRFYTINGMFVAALKATKASGPGKWQDNEGTWIWALDPPPERPATVVTSSATGITDNLFSNQLNGAPGSLTDKLRQAGALIAEVQSQLGGK